MKTTVISVIVLLFALSTLIFDMPDELKVLGTILAIGSCVLSFKKT